MFIRLRDCDSREYCIVDTDTARVWGAEAHAGRTLASAWQYDECYARALPGTKTPDGRFDVRGPVTLTEQATLDAGGAIPEERAALQLHLDFFDADLDGWIGLAESYRGWRALGFSRLGAALKSLFAALLFGRFAAGMAIDTTRFHDRRYASSGIFDEEGRIDQHTLDRYLAEFDRTGKPLGFDEVFELLRRQSANGCVSRRQFQSLFEVCRRLNGKAHISRAQFIGLFDGSLLWHAASMSNRAGRRARWLQPDPAAR